MQVEIKVTGRVQGVGFRFFVKNKADECRIFGWVRNTRDGGVEICAEGEKTDIETFINWVKQGPTLSRVNNIMINRFDKSEGFTTFKIKY